MDPLTTKVAEKLRSIADEHHGVCCHEQVGHLKVARFPEGFRVEGYRRDYTLEFDLKGNLKAVTGAADSLSEAKTDEITREAPRVIANSEGWPKEWLALFPKSGNDATQVKRPKID